MIKVKFNNGWLFSNLDGTVKRCPVTLPHDAMQTEKRIPGLKNGEATGFYPGGKYLYEKTLVCSADETANTTFLEFEGVYQKSRIYLNEELVGGHIYGYTDFFVDLTGKLKEGENLIKVIADNTQTPNSRWYTGSGIYRDVYIHTAKEEYLVPQSLKVKTLSITPARIGVQVDAVCEDDSFVEFFIYCDGKVVEKQMVTVERKTDCTAGSDSDFCKSGCAVCEIEIPQARLWSGETPYLYEVKAKLVNKKQCLDECRERFGIRQIKVSHEKGLQINGETVKLRGGCIHHDNGFAGACSFRNAELRRLCKMKEAGFNAIRYAHNPAGKAFLDACDEVGMYVMDETFDMWECKKSDRDYGMYFVSEWEGDVSAMVRVAYNHPSVIMYSIGNEIMDIGLPNGAKWSKKLVKCCHEHDDTRPVLNAFSPGLTCMAAKGIGINKFEANANDIVNPKEISRDSKASGSRLVNILITLGPLMMKIIGGPKRLEKLAASSIEYVDISGYNYGEENYPVHIRHHPDDVLVGSETFNSKISGHWKYVLAHDFMIGEFLWTAWDYLGETGIGLPRYKGMNKAFSAPYPCVTGYCGCFDLAGDLDGEGAHVMAVWNQLKSPFIAVAPMEHYGEKVSMGRWRSIDAKPTWTWDGFEGRRAKVYVFANDNVTEAELFLNGKSLRRKKMTENKAVFHVTYEPGELKAITYTKAGEKLGESSLCSAGKDTMLLVEADQKELLASEKEVAYIDIYITDAQGIRKTAESHDIMVEVKGAGELAGLGSGNPLPTEEYTENHCRSYNGHVVAVVRANGRIGDIEVYIQADGLETRTVKIKAAPLH